MNSLEFSFSTDLCSLSSFDTGELPKPNTTAPIVTTPAPTTQPHSCPDGEFVCGTHEECVSNSKVCDFRHDCSDGSDEFSCGKPLSFSQTVYVELFPSLSSLLPLHFSLYSEGTVHLCRRRNLWLEECRLLFGVSPSISLVT